MGFKCGIVGLPNVGKSTLFNALTASKNAEAANFPFCTIDPNIGIVDVIDDSSQSTKIKCWGVSPGDEIFINRPYVAKLDYDETWGFSCRGVFNFKMIG